MKRTLMLLLLCMFLVGQASAATMPENIQYFDGFNYPFTMITFTPLPDGAVVLAGWLLHRGEYRDMPDNMRYESKENEILVDAAAVCLNKDGSARWSLRLGDPRGENAFVCKGILPDGRLLFHFSTNDSDSFGSHYFIVNADGIVEEMLPTQKLAQIVPPKALMLSIDLTCATKTRSFQIKLRWCIASRLVHTVTRLL